MVDRRWHNLWRCPFWVVTLLPFMFFGWILVGTTTVGNDYTSYPVAGAQNLRFFTDIDLEPMWFPHHSGGMPVGGLFFSQYFHLPAWLTARLPGFWSGEALWWISLRHLLLFAVLHGVFYEAFRKMSGLGRLESLLLSGLCAYSLRTLDALRYAIALDATVYAFAAVLLAMLHVVRPALPLLVGVVVSTQLLLTCGYPVVVPFVLLGAVLSLPALVAVAGSRATLLRSGHVVAAALVGALLAAPNVVALAEWMGVSETRWAATRLEWAAGYAPEPGGLLDSLVAPWAADVHAAFGGTTLHGILLAVVSAGLLRRVRSTWPLVAGLAFAFVYAVGRATPLFALVFEHVPGLSALRAPGRVLIMLPLLLLAGVVWLRAHNPDWRLLGGHPARIGLSVGLLLVGLGLWGLGEPVEALPTYSPARLSGFWTLGPRALWLALGLVAAVALRWTSTSRWACAALIVGTSFQAGLLMRHGTWTAQSRPSPTRRDFQTASHLPLYGERPLVADNALRADTTGVTTSLYSRFRAATRRRANCVLPVDPEQRGRGILLPFYLTDATVCVGDHAEARQRLFAARRCLDRPLTQVFVADESCRPNPEATAAGLAQLNERTRILALTTNLVTVEVEAPREAVFVTPYVDVTSNWSGAVDEKAVPLLHINGGFLGLHVPPGRHTLSVSYFSKRMVAGYRVSAVTAVALGLVFIFWWLRRRPLVASLLVAALAATSFVAYATWEKGFTARARRQTILNHRYPELLSQQLARWRAVPTDSGRPPSRSR